MGAYRDCFSDEVGSGSLGWGRDSGGDMCACLGPPLGPVAAQPPASLKQASLQGPCPAHVGPLSWPALADPQHYLPTLLAVLGLEGEVACGAWRGPAFMEWKGGAHPRAFK